jgi:large subunit ribosomal protein L21
MLRKLNPLAGENRSFSWWWLGVKVGVVTALVIWWWLDQKNKKQLQQIAGVDSLDDGESIPLPDETPSAGENKPKAEPTPTEPDDLRKIEGIGPKIQSTLQTAGIETFAQLAAYKPTDLKQILVGAGIRIGFTDTWPEQAALAAAGDWDKLEALQKTLKAGRR